MAHIVDNQTVEGLVSTLNYRGQLTSTATDNTTTTLSLASTQNQVFTGSTAGQIVNCGIATNYGIGHEWWIYNESTIFISVTDNAGTQLLNLAPGYRVRIVLKDNSSSTGVWIVAMVISAATGGFFIANFSLTANSNNNVYLNTFGISSSDTLLAVTPIAGVISKVTIMLNGGTGTGTFEFRVNGTAVSFTAAISAAQTASVVVSYPVNANDQISCKIASGASGIAKPLVNIYM